MSWERPRFERPPRPDQPLAEARRGRLFNPLLIVGISVFAVAAFYVALVVAATTYPIFFPGNDLLPVKVSPFEKDNPDVADINQRINILVLGLDRRLGVPADTAARTDTVFILTIDPFSKTAGVFSIPRDLLVEIPDGSGGYNTDRINVVWEEGRFTYKDYPGGGPGLIKDTIKHNFDIPIDNYVILDFQNFIDLIDELGGIDIDVPEYVADYDYTDCQGCYGTVVEFSAGPQHMDGKTALAYARLRKMDSDFKRIERQQLVMKATAQKAMSINLFTDPGKAISLYGKYKDAIDTDISDLKIPGLAKLAQQIGIDNIRMVSMAGATHPCNCGPAATLEADWDKVNELKAQVFSNGRIQAEGALVELQNGTEQAGVAEEFAGFLRKQGISDQDLVLGDAAAIHQRTLIVDRSGKGYTAKKLAEWLNVPSDRVISGSDPASAEVANATGDIVVVIGSDARLATAAVGSGN